MLEKRTRWRCRRGLKELDVLLERFMQSGYTGASLEEKRAFAAFLELPDEELAAYLVAGVTPSDPKTAGVVRLVAAHCD